MNKLHKESSLYFPYASKEFILFNNWFPIPHSIYHLATNVEVPYKLSIPLKISTKILS